MRRGPYVEESEVRNHEDVDCEECHIVRRLENELGVLPARVGSLSMRLFRHETV